MKKTPSESYPLLKDTDVCVMCGMCIPHCPTYLIYQNEAESPRGRISLIQAYAQGRLTTSKSMLKHLDHCLGCQACEAMCPSGVPFGRLMDEIRSVTRTEKSDSFIQRQLLDSLLKPGRISRFSSLYNSARRIKTDKLIHSTLELTGHSQLSNLLAQNHLVKFKSYYPAKSASGSTVALFTGCMGTSFDGETLSSAIKVLNYYGYDVRLPKTSYCCGALHQHNGYTEQAESLAGSNRDALEQLEADYIVFVSNGCGDQLKKSLPDMSVADIMSFIIDQCCPAGDQFDTFDRTIVLHESCSTTNKLGAGGVSRKALELINGLHIVGFESSRYCCGAGGSHQITHADLTAELRTLKLNEIKNTVADYLVTDNLGCGLNFKAGLKDENVNLEVIHPVTLLARLLKW